MELLLKRGKSNLRSPQLTVAYVAFSLRISHGVPRRGHGFLTHTAHKETLCTAVTNTSCSSTKPIPHHTLLMLDSSLPTQGSAERHQQL